MSDLDIPESWAAPAIADVSQDCSQARPNEQFTYIDIESIDNKTQSVVSPKRLSPATAPSRARKIVVAGDVVFSTVRPYLKNIAIVPELDNPIASTGFCVLRAKGIENRFLFHYVKSDFFINEVSRFQKGANYPSVTDKIVKAQNMPLPPLGEQRRIVAKIESAHEKIKAIESAVNEAEKLHGKYRESLLSKAFRGELVPQDPNDEPASQLLARIRAEREANQEGRRRRTELPPITEDEIPFEIPPSWEWVRLGDVVDFIGGNQPPKSEFRSEKLPGYVRLVQIRDFKSDAHIVYIPESMARRRFTSTDIMIGRYGPPIFQILRGLEGAYNVALMKAVPTLAMSAEYLFWMLQEPRIQYEVNKKSERSAGQTGVNLDFLNSFLMPIPPKGEQERIAQFVKVAMERYSSDLIKFDSKRSLLKKFRASILDAAFTGKLVPQDPTEGTGHELLERIRAASAQQEGEATTSQRIRPRRQTRSRRRTNA